MTNSNQLPNFLEVKSTEVRTDKNERPYKYVVVSGQEEETFVLPGGKVFIALKPAQTTAFNAYEENYLGNQDFGWNFKPGAVVMGQIVTRTVTPYELKGTDGVTRQVSTYKTVVLGDTRDAVGFEVAVKAAFKNAGHPLTETVVATEAVAENSLMGK